MAAIFISHSSRDNELAAHMKSWLATQGYEQVFLDFDKHTGLRAGLHWESELYEKIARCHAVVLILTPNWLDSKWCFVEFAQARALGKIIFPIVLSPLGDKQVAPEIQGIDLKDWNRDGEDYLRRRIREVSDEIARGFSWDRARPPFPGIHAFDQDDAAIFFGRDEEIRDVISQLEARRVRGGGRLILILGGSGSGKSSLLRAGVLPQLQRDRTHWVVLPPFRPEREPLTNLAKSLAEGIGRPETWRSWRDRLSSADGSTALKEAADDLRLKEARNATLLLSIDQFEEIFTIAGADERDRMLEVLRQCAEPGCGLPYLAVGTMRSDVLDDLLQSRQFTIGFDDYLLRPMPLDRIAKVVEGPAAVAALTIEKGLSQRIINDVKSVEALPLLAFALRELYERYGQDRNLTISDYEKLGDRAAGLTPIENAVRRRADDVLGELRPSAGELAAFKQAFVPRLVRIRDDGTFVRQPALLVELPPDARRLIDAFVEARLLSKRTETGAHSARDVLIEISHEALFKAWPLLAGWLDEEKAFLAGKAQLARQLADWEAAPNADKPAALLSGLNLTRAQQWLRTHRGGLSPAEVAFVEASRRRERNRQVRFYGLALVALLAVATVGGRSVYSEYIRRTALACDLLAAEIDNNVSVPGVALDLIDWKAAIPACEAAVRREPDNPRLMHNLGRSLERAGRFEEAAYWYRQAADRDFAWSQDYLGVAYLRGQGVPVNFARAVELLRSAAGRGIAPAKNLYERVDFSVLFKDDQARTTIIQRALVSRGLLPAGEATGSWGAATEVAFKAFKQREQFPEEGITLRSLDKLGVVDELSKIIGRARAQG